MTHAHRVDKKIQLKDVDPNERGGLSREEGEAKFAELQNELVELQELLYATAQQSVIIVLQGRDTSGKDGAIRHVTGPLNSQGCEVASFKVPTEEELAHDFLWRIHKETPRLGQIKIFNRSHYEDVLVVRVHNLAPEKIWRARYDHINNFERLIHDANTIILKFYLHIDREEQEKRLIAREQDATKYWKLSVGDWKEREHWDEYTKAYEDALNECSTDYAPWYVVPANRKWFRNIAIAEAIANELRPLKASWLKRLDEAGASELAAVREYRKTNGIVVAS